MRTAEAPGTEPLDVPPSAAELDRLALRASRGDRRAFGDIVMACQAGVRLAVAWRAYDAELVEEVVQAAFVCAWQRLASYRGGGTFLPWLKAIARHLLAQELRRRRRHVGVDAAAVAVAADDADPPEVPLAALRACLERLSPRARALIERRYAEDASLPALAQRFKQRTNTIAVTLMRIRAELRACIEQRGARP